MHHGMPAGGESQFESELDKEQALERQAAEPLQRLGRAFVVLGRAAECPLDYPSLRQQRDLAFGFLVIDDYQLD